MKQSKNKKIAIDARFFGPRQTGLGRYVQRVIEHLEKIVSRKDSMQIDVLVSKEGDQNYHPTNRFFSKCICDYQWYSLSEQIAFSWILYKKKYDLIHFPHFNVPILYRKPYVMTIHDLIITHYPTLKATTLGPIKYFFKQFGYRIVIKNSLHTAKKILAVSDAVKKDICTSYTIPNAKVQVIYNAHDPLPKSSDQNLSPIGIAQHDRFVLYVGNAYPHKNLEMLIRVFSSIVKDHAALKLVITGKLDFFMKRLQKKAHHDASLQAKVIFTDFVDDVMLGKLYRRALCFVLPSFMEGFGIPLLEAMEAGTPILASNRTAIPEVCKDAALYFDPYSERDLKEKLDLLLSSKGLQLELIEKGSERVKSFSWNVTAKKILEIYKNCV